MAVSMARPDVVPIPETFGVLLSETTTSIYHGTFFVDFVCGLKLRYPIKPKIIVAKIHVRLFLLKQKMGSVFEVPPVFGNRGMVEALSSLTMMQVLISPIERVTLPFVSQSPLKLWVYKRFTSSLTIKVPLFNSNKVPGESFPEVGLPARSAPPTLT
ncbi:MAG: hypothetical protein UW44_C0008G0045 [Candidatus Collierbacteria bacterium GW2011_GWB2_44_22]|uniref:Uncharacterized protein n=1 Tax=Candidatus Collierbacteria bacterium GW2011_GWB2_44_22 TaxID=1618387 RepID=A0A0G1HYS6_9BACT|nr:MAG: hypothetical protein UW44_C0008G0045 [Candidatus Collierbacteria bacterium GW2011_GWB2_44_22]KKT66942.1 MAG: hypothetical protein UW58_C0001G0046 [Candidatus Collierbacteria bacterium GW2011_GWC2_44_30]